MLKLSFSAKEFVPSDDQLDKINKANEKYIEYFENNIMRINQWLIDYINYEQDEFMEVENEVVENEVVENKVVENEVVENEVEKEKNNNKIKKNPNNRNRKRRNLKTNIKKEENQKKSYADILKNRK